MDHDRRGPGVAAAEHREDRDEFAVGAVVAEGRNQWVRVPTPVPVLIFYSTVNVDADGRPRFLPDVYGLDAKLDAALRASQRGAASR